MRYGAGASSTSFWLRRCNEQSRVDTTTTLQMLKDVMARFVAERDWQQFHSPKNLVMGLSVEAAELG